MNDCYKILDCEYSTGSMQKDFIKGKIKLLCILKIRLSVNPTL
jgi:hypothetical protein